MIYITKKGTPFSETRLALERVFPGFFGMKAVCSMSSRKEHYSYDQYE